jgi:hypothetical protein
MDLKDIASLVDASAWPAVAVVGLVMFSRPLRGWLKDRPLKVKIGPIEAEWASAAAKAQVALESESNLAEAPGVGDDRHHEDKAAKAEPAASVIQEATSLEITLRRCLLEAGVEDTADGLAGLARKAVTASLISERTATAIEGIATLRNLAVHSPERITTEQASQFAALARTTESVIDARGRVAQNIAPGTDNVSPADIAILVRDNGPAEIVKTARSSGSPVKQRQAATALAQLGEVSAAIDIACAIQNRSEARSVGRAVLDYIAKLPGDQQHESLEQLERLRPRLGAPQLRDIREHAEQVGVKLPSEWMVVPAS